MSEELGVGSVSFGISGTPVGESGEGVSGGMVDSEESKTLMDNSSGKGILSDGIRVSEEAKVSVGSTAGTVISGSGWKAGDAGSLEINDKHDVSKQRVVEMMSRNNGWGSWGVMDLVGRVLEGKLSMDEEMEDIINSESRPGVDLVPDMHAWQGVVGEPTSATGIDVEGTNIDKDTDKLVSGNQSEGIGLAENRDLVSNEMASDGKLETEEVNNVNADMLIPKGRMEENNVNADMPIPKVCVEENNVNADMPILKAHVDKNNVNAGMPNLNAHVEENNVNACMPNLNVRLEENNVNAGMPNLKGCMEENNVNADMPIPRGHLEENDVNVEMPNPKGCVEENNVNDDMPIPKGCVEENDVNTDIPIPKGQVEENNVNADMPVLKGSVEENNVKADVLIPKGIGNYHRTEKEGEYYVSDLVWAKVRSHPWWPGQIFAPSAASDNAKKYFKRESYLVAYFGDQTFAWNEGAKIKPFRMYFSQMEKQSNADGFCHAVDCALDEVSRRVELGLSCPCLPQDMCDEIKFQDFASAGIREESSRIAGGDNLSSSSSFLPGEFVQFLGSVAESPRSITDRLQFVTKRAQLLAFNRWRGCYELPVFEELGDLEDDNQSSEMAKGKDLPGPDDADNFPSKKRKLTTLGGSSQKRKHMSGDEECPKIKEKRISVLMSSSTFPNEENKTLKKAGRMAVSSGKNHETIPSDTLGKRRKRLLSPSFSGDMASQSKTYLRESITNSAEKSQIVEIIPAGIPAPDVILSELMLAAKNPLRRNDTMISVAGLLRELRNSTCLEKSCSGNATKDKGKQPSSLDTYNTFGFEGIEDSYWTDRVIQSYPQDHVLFEPETLSESASELEANISLPLNLGNNKERDAGIVDSDQSLVMNDVSREYSPTALILNFTNLEAIPSVTNLNEIFSRYGPLIESETKILSKSKRAKLLFRRRADAETAFSSAGKYSIFGPSLISYRLNYAPTPPATSKQSRKMHL